VVDQPVMVVLGPDDVTLVPDAVARCRAAYRHLVGPYVVPDSGHFMQWENPAAVAGGLALFCAEGAARTRRPRKRVRTAPAHPGNI
jgi:pimeloyl-ACP methyl ester carboxylesterase